VDLGAWSNFNKMSFSKEIGLNRACRAAESLDSENLYVLRSSEFFCKLATIQEGPVFELLTAITARENLLMASCDYPDSQLLLGQVLGSCPVLEPFYQRDCTKLYSLLQYLELLFLIEIIVLKNRSTNTIKLILPNDEDKYYRDLRQLEQDISIFLSLRLDFKSALDIQLLCFNYGKRASNRPYLNTTQGLVDENAVLSMEDIVDEFSWVREMKGCQV
jgi:hypothetical protein